ncbi:MAG: 2-oxo-4-hydroxy-4-carboxy-5-ureidoimidazoline decarboxylase [Verrucomicrobia bacterium]|jgi:2-oxo-4-hydroxy-4-carboxy-5-ureidoimidazoline decarboxylase|nr:2-oxo-4-hydroxy-4-carboxy-5-ureidoimidazoline decarboxylase [Verrucomicrobiota bacterium]
MTRAKTRIAGESPVPLATVNQLSPQAFVELVGPVFEHSAWIAEAAREKRPFATREALHRALCDVVTNSTRDQQLALIRAHPDLVGRAALEGTLTRESTAEQASAGLGRLSPEEVALFQQYNAAYRNQFGFPFVICARLNKKAAILAGFEQRLKHSRTQEIKTALEEIFKIADLRLRDLIAH